MIYLASPYTHRNASIHIRRYNEACRVAAWAISAGYPLFSPIVHSHPLVKYGLGKTWKDWCRVDESYIGVCNELWVLCIKGWRDSVGVTAEIEFAEKTGKTIRFICLGDAGYEFITRAAAYDKKVVFPLDKRRMML